ncbi:MAG TPA: TonB-dependent receptor [Caulobacteraceae bacterium]|nr:TonB-dependent receptor [Caulobacteraceae bacterium]
MASASAAAFAILPAGRAMADTAQPKAASVQELIVTAQKREASIKDVPISITAVSGAKLADHGINKFDDLSLITPDFVVLPQGDSRNSSIVIRGVSTQQANIGQQASLGVFVDGVFMSRTGMGTTQDFFDIERVEVLRGPQGTLFGMNTAGGLINIITKKPDLNTFRGDFDVSYGSYNDLRLRGMVTGPIIPGELAFSLSGYSDSHDGYTWSPVRNQRIDNLRKQGARGKLEFQKGNFDATLTIDYQHESSICCSTVITKVLPGANVIGFPAAPLAPPGYPFSRESIASGVYTNPNSGGGVTLEMNWQLPGGTLTSLSSYRTWDANPISDVDQVSYNFLDGFENHQNHAQASEELRFTSPSGHKIEYVAGLFYFWRHSWEFDTVNVGPDASFLALPGQSGQTLDYWTDDDQSYAAFGHVDIHLTDQLTLSGGLRYSVEPQTGFYVQRSSNVIFPNLGPMTQKRDDKDLTWQADLSYKLTPDITAYASVATGFKPGGFDMNRLGNFTGYQFGPENSIDYEAGVKSDLLDHRLGASLALFWTNYDNYQALAWDGTNLITRNAASFVSRGVEFEIDAQPLDGLSLSFNGSYLDAHFTSFPNGPCPPGVPGVCELAGYRLSGAPTWNLNFSGKYERPISADWNGFVILDASYKGLIEWTDNDPNTYWPGYTIANARIGVSNQHGLQVSLFANNVTNTNYMTFIFASPLASGLYVGFDGAPRVFGVELRKSF